MKEEEDQERERTIYTHLPDLPRLSNNLRPVRRFSRMVVVGYGVHALSNNNKDHHDDDDGGWLIVVLCNMHKHSHLAEGLRASTLI